MNSALVVVLESYTLIRKKLYIQNKRINRKLDAANNRIGEMHRQIDYMNSIGVNRELFKERNTIERQQANNGEELDNTELNKKEIDTNHGIVETITVRRCVSQDIKQNTYM